MISAKEALVTLIVERVQVGRTRSGRCVVSGAERKRGKRCVRYDYAGKTNQLGRPAGPSLAVA